MSKLVEHVRKVLKGTPLTRKQIMSVEEEMDAWMKTFGGRRLRIAHRRLRKRRRKPMRDGDIQDVASIRKIE